MLIRVLSNLYDEGRELSNIRQKKRRKERVADWSRLSRLDSETATKKFETTIIMASREWSMDMEKNSVNVALPCALARAHSLSFSLFILVSPSPPPTHVHPSRSHLYFAVDCPPLSPPGPFELPPLPPFARRADSQQLYFTEPTKYARTGGGTLVRIATTLECGQQVIRFDIPR